MTVSPSNRRSTNRRTHNEPTPLANAGAAVMGSGRNTDVIKRRNEEIL